METNNNFHDFTIGGYPEEMFLDLTTEEKARGECSICFLVSCEPRECALGHIFCTSCIVSWATGTSGASGKCPVCRAPGRYYRPATDTRGWLHKKWVRCLQEGCQWTGVLRELKYHRQKKHRNSDSDVMRIPLAVFQKNKYALMNNRREELGESMLPSPETSIRAEVVSRSVGSVPGSEDAVSRDAQDPETPSGDVIQRELLSDVDCIRHQLSEVSSSLSVLLQRMGKDQERYTSYIRDQPHTASIYGLSPRGALPSRLPSQHALSRNAVSTRPLPAGIDRIGRK